MLNHDSELTTLLYIMSAEIDFKKSRKAKREEPKRHDDMTRIQKFALITQGGCNWLE